MIEVKEISLNITLPDNGIGMVIMQPFVELCDDEPYHWQNDKKVKQIERIIRTLEIAKQADHGCEKTHFTVFPEYAIPGLEGVRKIQEILERSSWKDGTIVVGGVDGLTKKEYSTLCNEGMTQEVHKNNKAEKVRDDQWVNCCITWEKTTNNKGNVICSIKTRDHKCVIIFISNCICKSNLLHSGIRISYICQNTINTNTICYIC